MTPEEWAARVKKVVDELFEAAGPEGSVVIMVGFPDGPKHSRKVWEWRGRCLSVEGLLARSSDEIRKDLWKGV